MNHTKMLDPDVAGRMAWGVEQVRLRHILEDAPDDKVATMLVLSTERASTIADDLATLRKVPPAARCRAADAVPTGIGVGWRPASACVGDNEMAPPGPPFA